MTVEQIDYEYPRCLTRYILSIAEADANDPPNLRDFRCPKCNRWRSEFAAEPLRGKLIAYRLRGKAASAGAGEESDHCGAFERTYSECMPESSQVAEFVDHWGISPQYCRNS
jgi:hypothetical protein